MEIEQVLEGGLGAPDAATRVREAEEAAAGAGVAAAARMGDKSDPSTRGEKLTKKLHIPRVLPDCLAQVAATTAVSTTSGVEESTAMLRVGGDGNQHPKVLLSSEMKSNSDPIKIPKLISPDDSKTHASEHKIEQMPQRRGEKPCKAGVTTGSWSPEALTIKKSTGKWWKPSKPGKSADSRVLMGRDGGMIVRDTDSVAGARAEAPKMLSPEEMDQQYAMSAAERGRYEIIFMRVGFQFRRDDCGVFGDTKVVLPVRYRSGGAAAYGGGQM